MQDENPSAIVINNNQPGDTFIGQTPPHTTLPVGTELYAKREETLTTGQPKIATYRNLSQAEIDMMNLIKASETSIAVLFGLVHDHLQEQLTGALNSFNGGQDSNAIAGRDKAQPERWVAMARTDFQVAFMKLTRAVAQPNSAL